MSDAPPVFVVGVPRSGTSLLFNILIKLDAFAGTETGEWNTETSIFKKFPRLLYGLYESDDWPFWQEYFAGSKRHFDQFIQASCRNFLEHAAVARGARRILEKTPNHIETLALVFACFPGARVLHIHRHPVDVLTSMRERAAITPSDRHPWLRVSAHEFALSYTRKLEGALDWPGEVMSVGYEELTSTPEDTLATICAFLEEPVDLQPIRGPVPQRTRGDFPFRSSVPVPNPGEWRKFLSREELSSVQKVCGPVMTRLGYSVYPRTT